MLLTDLTQDEAYDILMQWKNVFLTGKAGTGKSYLTKKFIAKKKERWENVVVVAPTGIAAINVGWATIHSTFNMFGMYLNITWIKKQKVFWDMVDVIVIDEISMVWPDYIDYMDFLLKKKCNNDLPFWGIQMVFVWDPKQIPPVYASKTEQDAVTIAGLYEKYKILDFEHAEAFQWFECLNLSKIYRQTDDKFITILNAIREWDMSALRFIRPGKWDNATIHLKPYNTMVDSHNRAELESAPGKKFTYHGTLNGTFKEANCITPLKLELKVWTKIMVTKNLMNWLVNGDMWTVLKCGKDFCTIYSFRMEQEYELGFEKWKEVSYEWVEEVETGSFIQMPLKLAYALTINKSQGLTLDSVCLTYVKGMSKELVYVGLSRCTSLETLYLNRI